MGDVHFEKHIENLIKMRSEIRSALNAYKLGNTGAEVYFMVRAKAVADALGISNDEFLDHKMLVEKEEGMVDCLMMPQECINSLNEYYNKPKEMETCPKPTYKVDPAHMQDIFSFAKNSFLTFYDYFTEKEYDEMITEFFKANYTAEEMDDDLPLEECTEAVQRAYGYK